MRNVYKNNKIKKFTNKMQAKLLLVFCILILGMVGLIWRLVMINHTDGERYEKRVLSQQTYSSTVIPYQRGSILDRNGTVMAVSEKVYNVILDVNLMLQKESYYSPTKNALVSCYESITEEIITNLVADKPESRYSILKKAISYDEMMLFKELAEQDSDIKGVWFEEDYVRKYPYSTLASDVIGFTSSGNVGNWGIEQYYNEMLNGTNGIEYGYIDTELKLEHTVKSAINGNTVVSTIDANVQGIVQNHIKAFNEEYGSENIGVLIMNPNNGEILAMASNEEYDLNNPTDLTPFYTTEEIKAMNEEERLNALNAIWRNFVISDAYEPGSTFKPFTIAAGLEEDIIHSEDTFFCDGKEVFGKYTIKCSKRSGHGQITLTQALMLSCNDALMQIAAKQGRNIFYDYEYFFGFGHKTGIDLPGEASGILVKKENLNETELATSSFGQSLTNTMVQLATGFSALINGGYYYEPHIVKQILTDQGTVVTNKDKVLVKRSVSSETSDFIKEAMYLTVEEGTAQGAQVSGYKVGGKTGTAQKQPRTDETYLVSFIGSVPADNPEVVIYVVIDEPQNVVKQADSSIATKFASRILTDVLPFLEIYPTEEVEEDKQTILNPILPSTNTKEDPDTTEEDPDTTEEDPDTTGENNTAKEETGAESETGTSNSEENNSSGSNSTEEEDYDFLPEMGENETETEVGN